jgi:hypothetical protein
MIPPGSFSQVLREINRCRLLSFIPLLVNIFSYPPSPSLYEVYQMLSNIKLMAFSAQVGI